VVLLQASHRHLAPQDHVLFKQFALRQKIWKGKGWWKSGTADLTLSQRALLLLGSSDLDYSEQVFDSLWKSPIAHTLTLQAEPPWLKQYLDFQPGGRFRHCP